MKCFIIAFFCLLHIHLFGQVGIGTNNPNPSSALEINSTTKGLLPPRMTKVQRDAISNPSAGLFIWCTNCSAFGEAQFFNGIFWMTVSSSTTGIGQPYQGGIIAYILQPGDPGYDAAVPHGLIAAPTDQSSAAEWGCWETFITGADGIAIGTGNQNTLDIINGCATAGIAARLCNDLVLGGYTDWYLPSKNELIKLYDSKDEIGGFVEGVYWSSSEFNEYNGHVYLFYSGEEALSLKDNPWSVRAIRSF